MKFSQRKGITPILNEIQINSINDSLRAQLWNVIYIQLFDVNDSESVIFKSGWETIITLGQGLYIRYFKKPIDKLSRNSDQVIKEIREYFFSCQWYEVYDFIEELLLMFKETPLYDKFENKINIFLEREFSGFRFIDGICTDIISETEISEIKDALEDDKFRAVQEHITRAIELLYNREKPDYRNSIKESISAVESIAKEISSNPKAKLGEALNVIEREKKLHPALKEAFSKLYGYTNDADGIRHALMEESTLTAADAKFFLVSCSAFINYLKSNI